MAGVDSGRHQLNPQCRGPSLHALGVTLKRLLLTPRQIEFARQLPSQGRQQDGLDRKKRNEWTEVAAGLGKREVDGGRNEDM